MTYIIDKKNDMCPKNKLHPLTARRGKLISGKMYRDTEKGHSASFREIYHFRGWRKFIKSEIDSL